MVRVDLILPSGASTIAEQGLEGFEITGATVKTALNEISSATLSIPSTNVHAEALAGGIAPVVAIYDDDRREFYGRVASVKRDIFGGMEVSLDGPLSFLGDIVKDPFQVTNRTHESYIHTIIDQYNAAMIDAGTVERAVWFGGVLGFEGDGNVDIHHADEYISTLDLFREAVELYGGYIYENFGGGAAMPAVGWVKTPTIDSGVVLEFGVNELTLETMLDFSEYASRVYGISSQFRETQTNNDAEAVYGRRDYAYKSNAETYEQFSAEIAAILNQRSVPVQTIELTAIDLATMNHSYRSFQVGTTATALDRKMGLSVEMMVTSVERDLISRGNSRVVFGRAPQLITDVIRRK